MPGFTKATDALKALFWDHILHSQESSGTTFHKCQSMELFSRNVLYQCRWLEDDPLSWGYILGWSTSCHHLLIMLHGWHTLANRFHTHVTMGIISKASLCRWKLKHYVRTGLKPPSLIFGCGSYNEICCSESACLGEFQMGTHSKKDGKNIFYYIINSFFILPTPFIHMRGTVAALDYWTWILMVRCLVIDSMQISGYNIDGPRPSRIATMFRWDHSIWGLRLLRQCNRRLIQRQNWLQTRAYTLNPRLSSTFQIQLQYKTHVCLLRSKIICQSLQ